MAADPAPEEQFGPYVVYERLGVGGMATVHRARERGIEGFERVVALKRLLPHLAEDASFIKSFVREAKLASLLNHNNIVQIFELGRVGAEYFISMEYIDGRDIRQILRHARKVTGPPPINVSVGLLLQLCEALDYAHTKVDDAGQPLGLVHRDVSPSNLLVTSAGHLKVIDFGIAKAQSQQLRTQTGRVKGKLAYMAPEAISGAKDLDARSDLFAAGVIAHELLTARPLFASKNEYQTLLKVQRGDIMPPSTYNPKVPPELDAIVLQALARDADDRFASALELRDALLKVKHQQKLATGHRDLAQWLTYAFAQVAPGASDASQSLVDVSAVRPVAPRRPPTPRPGQREEEEAVEVAWGGGEEPGSADPVLLDEVPDVSDKHLVPERFLGAAPRIDSVDDLADDIPPSRPSDGARLRSASVAPPRSNAHLSVPAGLPRPGSGTQPPPVGRTRTSNSMAVPAEALRARTTSSTAAPVEPQTTRATGAFAVPMPDRKRASTSQPPATAATPRAGGRTVPPRVAAATMPPPIAVAAPSLSRERRNTEHGLTGQVARIDPANLVEDALADLAQGEAEAAAAEAAAAAASLEPSAHETLPGTEPSDTAPSLLAMQLRPTPRPSPLPAPRAPADRAPITRPSTPPPVRTTPAPTRATTPPPVRATTPPPVRPSALPSRPSIPPSLAEGHVSARMLDGADGTADVPSLVPAASGLSSQSGVPRTKPGVGPARTRANTRSVPPRPSSLAAALPETRPVTLIGSAIIERTSVKRTWIVLLGLAVLGGAAAGVGLYLTHASTPAPKVEPKADAVPPGKIKFDTQPVDAEITVEGYPMHAGAPWSLPLPPGTYPVRITRAGYKTWETAIELSSAETSTLRVVLEPLPTEGATDTATLALDSSPTGLEALVDGVKLPSLTPVKTTIAPGSHVIVLRQRGVDVWKHNLIAQANADYQFAPLMTAEKLRERAQRASNRGDADAEARTPTPTPTPAPTRPTPPIAPTTGSPTTAVTTQPGPPPGPATGTTTATTASTSLGVPTARPTPTPLPVPTTPPPHPGIPTPNGTSPKPLPTPTPTPTPITPRPPAAGPAVVPPTAVKKLSGDKPTVGVSHLDDVPAIVAAKVCIDTGGSVTTVALITKVERQTALDLSSAVKTWRYTPYLKSGVATPACFVVSFRVK